MTKPKAKFEGQCGQCGAVFLKTGQHQKYCSKPCQKLSKVEHNREYGKTYIRKNPVKRMIAAAKSRSKLRGIEFNITDDDVIVPDTCPVLGFPMRNYTSGICGGRYDSFSLDRIDPSKGYIKGNVQVISHMANGMKSSATPEQLVMFAKWILSQYAECSE